MESSRQTAFSALMRVEKDSSYSNITLDLVLSKSNLSQRDKNFVSGIFYGVIEKRLFLDYNISVYSDRPLNELDMEIAVILRMGLYQIFFMDSVPNSAAVNESVKLCHENRLSSASGFVNGILRAASEGEAKLPNPKKSKSKFYSVMYSCPESIVRMWRHSYGDEMAKEILMSLEGRPPMNARVNTLKTSAESLKKSFEESGITAEYSDCTENCLKLSNTGSIESLVQYREGLFHIQDTASQLCCKMLEAEENQIILDVCSAPGGKSFTLAEMMNNKGKIISCDLYEARTGLVEKGAKRLGIDIIKTKTGNSAEMEFPMADRVLCDVPCSGLGIIRRKPELRYKEDLGLDELPDVQYEILCNSAKFVKAGGILIYSTCTLNPWENNENARKFLEEHEDFEAYALKIPENIKRGIEENKNELTLFPQINDTDGFFISAFRKK